MKYRRILIDVDAVQWRGDNPKEVIDFAKAAGATSVTFSFRDQELVPSVNIDLGYEKIWGQMGFGFICDGKGVYSMPGETFTSQFQPVTD